MRTVVLEFTVSHAGSCYDLTPKKWTWQKESSADKKDSRTDEKSRFSEEQIINVLREAEGQTPVKDVCTRHNISEATFYKWRVKFGGMDVNEARRLRSLEEENSRLKCAVAVRVIRA